MTIAEFSRLSDLEQKAIAVNVSDSMKEFVAGGNSASLAQKFTRDRHRVSIPVFRLCLRMADVTFIHNKGRKAKFNGAFSGGVDVF